MGIHVLAEPALDIRPVSYGRPPERPDALVFTSAHGVRHHPQEPSWRGIPVYTVGDRTAEAAQRSGYQFLHSANGDVGDLQRLIRATLPVSSRLLHYGARETAGDLCGELVSAGYRASKRVVYEAVPAPASSIERIHADLPMVDEIIVHSPRAALLAARLASDVGWSGTVFCLSKNCANAFVDLPGTGIIVAAKPREDSLMAVIRNRLSDRPAGDARAAAWSPVARLVPSRSVGVAPVAGPANDNGGHLPPLGFPGDDDPDDPSPTAA